ncbi:MAG: HAMP domain-containing sensor histidine kinase [Bacteroidota bacterium]
MFTRRFRINVAARSVLLGLACLVLAYTLLTLEERGWFMAVVFAGVAVAGLIIELVRYVEKTNRDLTSFLYAIKYQDFTQNFTSLGRGGTHDSLRDAFNSIVHAYQNLRAEKESHYQYLQTVVQHVKVALLCFKLDGEIELMNDAAGDLLRRPYLNTLSGLERTHPKLYTAIQAIRPGEKKLVEIQVQQDLLQLSLQCTTFKLQEEAYKLVSLQNIQSELEKQEVDTWQKLIRVLTHEIMNSVTPIISLTGAINDLLEDETGAPVSIDSLDEEDIEDIHQGIRTVQNRSKGMLHFVRAYRSLTNIQQPEFTQVSVEEMMESLQTLFQPELRKRNIKLKMEVGEALFVRADRELLEQVLINLIKNGMEALEGRAKPTLTLEASNLEAGKVAIRVKDNGAGIPAEFRQQVFIPFFTTKKKGSGIGLSLSRQIMQLHEGAIKLETEPEKGTVFTLVLPESLPQPNPQIR